MKQSLDYNILYFRHVIFGVAGTESCYMKQSRDYNILYFRHVVLGVAGTETCYMKQSIDYNILYFRHVCQPLTLRSLRPSVKCRL